MAESVFAPKSGFEAWLRGAMAEIRHEHEIAAYSRAVTGQPVTVLGQDRSEEVSGRDIPPPEIRPYAPGELSPGGLDAGIDQRQRERFESLKTELQQRAELQPGLGPDHGIDR